MFGKKSLRSIFFILFFQNNMFLNLSFWGWETNLQWKMLDISMMFSTQKNHTISSESPNGSRQVDGIKTSDKLLLGHVPCVWVDTCRVFPYLGEPRKRRGSTGRNGEYIENWWVQKVWDQPPMLHYRMEPLFNFIGWVNHLWCHNPSPYADLPGTRPRRLGWSSPRRDRLRLLKWKGENVAVLEA